MANEPGTFSTPLQRILVDPTAPPKVAHQVIWSRIGDEVLLEIGYVDMVDIAVRMKGGDAPPEAEPPRLFITDRFVFSPDSARRLLRSINELASSMEPTNDAPA